MEEKSEIWHWSERIANELLAKGKESYLITAGMTTSGPTHLGTVCEFLFPYIIKKKTQELSGKSVKYIFIADILDAFDSIPVEMEKYRAELEPHLGKPLCNVPDPVGISHSFGEHYLDEAIEVMKLTGVYNEIELKKANELYKQGAFDKYAITFIQHIEKVKEIIQSTSGRTLKADWQPIMAICEKCGKIATTRITKLDALGNYEYACDLDAEYTKGCGYKGSSSILKHNYKLQWRLHWPSWQNYLQSDIEGGGVDHFTKGGSFDTAKAIHKEIFKTPGIIGYKYGFLLIDGKKYSKSKGRGMAVRDMVKLVPAKALAYHLVKFDLEENIDFTPDRESILQLVNDFEYASSLSRENLSKADRKKYASYNLLGGKNWNGNFRDYLMYYQIYKNWDKVKFHLSLDEEDIKHVKPFIEQWISQSFVPEEYDFNYSPQKAEGIVKEFFSELKEGMDPLQIHNFIYDFANRKGVKPNELFSKIYQTLILKEKGPRLGKFISALGIEEVKKQVL